MIRRKRCAQERFLKLKAVIFKHNLDSVFLLTTAAGYNYL